MSQLIALIIAIALGAIVTAIGYVFLGDAFTKNAERGVALQFINQASQVEMAMTASRAENAKTAFLTDWAGTTDSGVSTSLVGAGYLKAGIVAPQGSYEMYQSGGDVVLVASSGTTDLSVAVCTQINKLSSSLDETIVPTTAVTDGATAITALDGKRYACFADALKATATAGSLVFAYEVE